MNGPTDFFYISGINEFIRLKSVSANPNIPTKYFGAPQMGSKARNEDFIENGSYCFVLFLVMQKL
jgi:hypothetical protein